MRTLLADGSAGELPVYVEETPLPSPKSDYFPNYPSNGKVQSGFPWGIVVLIAVVVVIVLLWGWARRKQ